MSPPDAKPPPIPAAKPPPLPRPLPAKPAAAEPSSPPEPAQGYQAEPERRMTVYQLAAALALAALFSTIPAIMDVIEHLTAFGSAGVSRWAVLLLLAGCLQIAYAVYLAQLPDWSVVWVASLVSLVLATVYAMLLGVFVFADEHSQFIRVLELEDKLSGNRAAGWCVIMLSLSCLLAYGMGRFSVRWHRVYQITVAAGASRNGPLDRSGFP
jgi:hypothetical protein